MNQRAPTGSFADFVQDSAQRLGSLAYLVSGNQASAEDLLQETLLQLWRHWEDVPEGARYSYARRVMVNKHTDQLRRLRIYRQYLRDSQTTQALIDVGPADSLTRIDERDELARALKQLPPRQRSVLILRYYEDLSDIDIAAILGMKRSTVRSQCARALKRLNNVLPARESPQ